MLMFLTLAALQAAPTTTAQTAPTPPPACTSEAHDAFDFWVGDWQVTPRAGGAVVATSKIEKLYGGCAVRENWMPVNGTGGGSLNSIAADGRWYQRWVGSSGETVDFVGGLNKAGQMVLTGWWRAYGGPGNDQLVRMTYTANEDGSVRQHGEISSDHGTSWATGFDLIYRPANAE